MTPEKAATSLGFDIGRAYAIRALPPQGKTTEALEHQMADDEKIVGLPHLRTLFRQYWCKGYHYWHVYQLAKEFLEREQTAMQIVHRQTRQQGEREHDPWMCEFLCIDPVSEEVFPCGVEVRWVTESSGIAVNWWMVAPIDELQQEGERFGPSRQTRRSS